MMTTRAILPKAKKIEHRSIVLQQRHGEYLPMKTVKTRTLWVLRRPPSSTILMMIMLSSIVIWRSTLAYHTSSNNIKNMFWWEDDQRLAETWSVNYEGRTPYDHIKAVDSLPDDPHHHHRRDQTNGKSYIRYDNNTAFRPLQIGFHTEPIEQERGQSSSKDDEIDHILNNVLPQAAEFWSRHLAVLPVQQPLTIGGQSCYGIFGSLSDRVFNNTDLVIVVGGQATLESNNFGDTGCEGSRLAFASTCVLDQFDRPVLGFLNFCLDFASQQSNRTNNFQQVLQQSYQQWTGATFRDSHLDTQPSLVIIHEMAHILGHSSWMFKYFRYPDGTPRTPRPLAPTTATCADGSEEYGYFPSENTVQSVRLENGLLVQMIVTPRVQQVARNHFNCQQVLGARIDETATGCIGTHWRERDWYTELMSSSYTPGSQNVLSPLTLALLDDSGWYHVNYRNVNMSTWGLNAGCSFGTDNCIQNDAVPSWGNEFFCNAPFEVTSSGIIDTSTLNSVFCDPAHYSWTLCSLTDISNPGLTQALYENVTRYFSNTNWIAIDDSTDYCPLPDLGLGLDCRISDPYSAYYPGEEVGPSSRCIDTSATISGSTMYRPACMQVTCDRSNNVVRLGSGNYEQVCQEDFQVLPIAGSTIGASFICPRLSTLCPEMVACPGHCSGRGICQYNGLSPTCACYDGDNTTDGCYPYPSLASPGSSPAPTTAPAGSGTSPTPRPVSTVSPTSSAETVQPTRKPRMGPGGGVAPSSYPRTVSPFMSSRPTSASSGQQVATSKPSSPMSKPTISTSASPQQPPSITSIFRNATVSFEVAATSTSLIPVLTIAAMLQNAMDQLANLVVSNLSSRRRHERSLTVALSDKTMIASITQRDCPANSSLPLLNDVNITSPVYCYQVVASVPLKLTDESNPDSEAQQVEKSLAQAIRQGGLQAYITPPSANSLDRTVIEVLPSGTAAPSSSPSSGGNSRFHSAVYLGAFLIAITCSTLLQ